MSRYDRVATLTTTHGSFRFPLLYARRHDVRARSPRDVPFQDPAPVLAVALALTLAPVAEARVQVRPVEQTVVLDLFSPSDFNDLGVQRDFCRAFTASIDLDERVGRVKTQKFPTFQPSLCTFSHLPRRHSKPREPIRLVGFLFGGAFLGRPARYTKIIMRFMTKLKY